MAGKTCPPVPPPAITIRIRFRPLPFTPCPSTLKPHEHSTRISRKAASNAHWFCKAQIGQGRRATIPDVMMTQDLPQTTSSIRPTDTEQPSLAKLGAGIAATVIGLDQLTKLVIETTIGPNTSQSSYWFVGDWLGFQYVRNTGVAFGIKLGSGTLTLVVSSLAFLIVGMLFWRLAAKNQVAAIGAGLLAGGAIGNLIDRARFDAVVDFVAIGPWPRFNIADSAITIGVLILAWSASGGHQGSEPDSEEHAEHG